MSKSTPSYAWPRDACWQPECNALCDELRPRILDWEMATFGMSRATNYDPAYLISVFQPATTDAEFLYLTARFAYVLFTLDTILERYASEVSGDELARVLDCYAEIAADPPSRRHVELPSPMLRLHGEQLEGTWRELLVRFPSTVHRDTMSRSIRDYFESVPLEIAFRNDKAAHSLADYERFRPHTVQCIVGYDVLNMYVSITAEDMVTLARLRDRASLLTGVVNDIASFPRERREERNSNLVAWTIAQRGCSDEAAIQSVVQYANGIISECTEILAGLTGPRAHLLPIAKAYVKASAGICDFFDKATRYESDEIDPASRAFVSAL